MRRVYPLARIRCDFLTGGGYGMFRGRLHPKMYAHRKHQRKLNIRPKSKWKLFKILLAGIWGVRRALMIPHRHPQLELVTTLSNISAQVFQLFIRINNMGDLVLLRDLIKSSARGQAIDLNVLFRHLNSDSLSECVVASAASPCSAEDLAREYNFLGAKSGRELGSRSE